MLKLSWTDPVTASSAPESDVFQIIGAQMPDVVRELFRKPPLLRHEDPKIYWRLVRTLAEEMRPQDVVDWLLLMDLVNQAWETVRNNGFNVALIEADQRAALAELFAPVGKATA